MEPSKHDPRADRDMRRRLENREAILHAGEAVILRKGFSEASMDDVAAEARFSKATLYRYFDSKSEMMLEILIHFLDDLQKRLEEIISAPGRPVRERFQDTLACILSYMENKEGLAKAFMSDHDFHKTVSRLFEPDGAPAGAGAACLLHHGGFMAHIQSHGASIAKCWETLLAEGVASGEFRPLDVPAAVLFIGAVVQGVFSQRFWSTAKPGLADNVSLILDFVWRGIMARPAGQGVAR